MDKVLTLTRPDVCSIFNFCPSIVCLVHLCGHYINGMEAFVCCIISLPTSSLRYSHSVLLYMFLQYSAVNKTHQHDQVLYTVCEQSECVHVKCTLVYTNTKSNSRCNFVLFASQTSLTTTQRTIRPILF